MLRLHPVTTDKFMVKYRFNEIDLLRGVACLMVVAFHYLHRGQLDHWVTSTAPPMVEAFARYGYLGVHLFFIISGFVIFMSADGSTTRQFAASRAARLYPAFWVAALLTTAVVWWSGNEAFKVSFGQLAVNMTMAPHWWGVDFVDGAYWSIAVEIHFYILVALALATGYFSRPELLVAVWLVLSAGNVLRPVFPLEFWLEVRWAPLFCAGICAYLVRARGVTALRVALYGASYILAMAYSLRPFWADTPVSAIPRDNPWIVGAAITVFFAVFAAIAADLWRLPATRLSTWVGLMTYPVYLIHQNIGYILIESLNGAVPSLVLRSLLVLIVVGAAAWLIVRFVERPLSPLIRGALAPKTAGSAVHASKP